MRSGNGVQYLGERRFGAATVLMVQVETRRGAVYLCVDDVAWSPDKRYVVMVDSGRLSRVWRQELGNDQTGFDWDRPSTWSQDHKFARADAEMPNQEHDPVALPKARCRIVQVPAAVPPSGLRRLLGLAPPTEARPELTLIDGITRTLWLVHHGARAIPMECADRDDAQRLADIAGVPGSPVLTVSSLRHALRQPRQVA
jgi:hypothetical protein